MTTLQYLKKKNKIIKKATCCTLIPSDQLVDEPLVKKIEVEFGAIDIMTDTCLYCISRKSGSFLNCDTCPMNLAGNKCANIISESTWGNCVEAIGKLSFSEQEKLEKKLMKLIDKFNEEFDEEFKRQNKPDTKNTLPKMDIGDKISVRFKTLEEMITDGLIKSGNTRPEDWVKIMDYLFGEKKQVVFYSFDENDKYHFVIDGWNISQDWFHVIEETMFSFEDYYKKMKKGDKITVRFKTIEEMIEDGIIKSRYQTPSNWVNNMNYLFGEEKTVTLFSDNKTHLYNFMVDDSWNVTKDWFHFIPEKGSEELTKIVYHIDSRYEYEVQIRKGLEFDYFYGVVYNPSSPDIKVFSRRDDGVTWFRTKDELKKARFERLKRRLKNEETSWDRRK